MVKDVLSPLKFYGLVVNKEKNNEAICDCIFCGKENHLYANMENGLWDCKRCSRHGDLNGFLTEVYLTAKEHTKEEHYQKLSAWRNIPADAFKRWNVVFNEKKYLFPGYNLDKKIVNLRLCFPNTEIINSEGVNAFLFGVEQLADLNRKNEPVYLCEGEWDAIALDWLLRRCKKPGICIGTPGTVFKPEWAMYFNGRIVYLPFDNDGAGLKFIHKVEEILKQAASKIHSILWEPGLKEGYDVNDLVRDIAIKESKPFICYQRFNALLNHKSKQSISTRRLSLEELLVFYKNWIHLNERITDAIKLTLATVISSKLPGTDPVWLFLVGPPGCGKTTIISSVKSAKCCYFQSALRKTALISGMTNKKILADPSILPKINKKCLVLKDFTELLVKPASEREEVFGILRGAYDGSYDLDYGHWVARRYNSMFSIVAGVTREIFAYNTAALGERFLKFNLGSNEIDEELQQEKSMETAIFGDPERSNVQEVVGKFLDSFVEIKPEELKNFIPGWFRPRLKPLASLVASLRTTVPRFERGFQQNEVIYKPQKESGNRIANQMQRLAISIAIIEGKDKIDEEIFQLLIQVAIDSLNEYIVEIVTILCKSKMGCSLNEISSRIKMSNSGVINYLSDLEVLGIVTNKGRFYTISDRIREQWLRIFP